MWFACYATTFQPVGSPPHAGNDRRAEQERTMQRKPRPWKVARFSLEMLRFHAFGRILRPFLRPITSSSSFEDFYAVLLFLSSTIEFDFKSNFRSSRLNHKTNKLTFSSRFWLIDWFSFNRLSSGKLKKNYVTITKYNFIQIK